METWDLFLDYDARAWSQAQRVKDLLPRLKAKAAATQAPILAMLEEAGTAVEPGSVRSFWITNILFAKVQKSVLVELSNRPDVQLLDWNAPLDLVESVDEGPAPPVEPNGTEPGLEAINAPALWAMGYTGYGTVNFVNDTGVDPNHPALKPQYRGLYRGDDESWFQFQGVNNGPYDCVDHGTHVAGIMQGLNRATHDTTGVAFNSQWIGGAILCGIGTSDNIAAFQWALDPDNDENTVDDMPDVLNNSWRDSSLDDDCTSVYVNVLNALEAAGIAVVFSAGNAGPGVQTITPPHNINTDLVNVFCVGSLDANSASLSIANSSSRGPSNCGGDSSLLIKPEVSAPGVSVRSCLPGGSYGNKSGTSMAAPHAAGAILLLKEAFPDLLGYEIKEALYFTCTDLGIPGEDNTFGMGIINVEAAFNYLVDAGHLPVDPQVENDVQLVR
ncbi:MAG: S8 family serine peptidase, partial [Phaeodactylibacter sp.]|nr:S8 family serine peptidase [Phaeodactylibacter sp.]